VNGRRVNIPSCLVKPGDVVAVREKSREIGQIKEALESVARRSVPAWLELDVKDLTGTIKALPAREDLTMPMQEQLIVELYSR
jgi:small subunit ribosomal protein S4